MIDADIDSIEFAPGANNKVILSGSRLPFKHGIATIHHLPGDVFQISVRADAFTEEAKKRETFIGRFFSMFLPSARFNT